MQIRTTSQLLGAVSPSALCRISSTVLVVTFFLAE